MVPSGKNRSRRSTCAGLVGRRFSRHWCNLLHQLLAQAALSAGESPGDLLTVRNVGVDSFFVADCSITCLDRLFVVLWMLMHALCLEVGRLRTESLPIPRGESIHSNIITSEEHPSRYQR